jgi:MarR family transcriptional regulator for hemolysin
VGVEPLGRKLVFTAKALRVAFEETLTAAGASLGTWVVLSALSDEGVLSQTKLAEHIHVDGATITHHVDRMEALGLVRRQLDPTDRRVRRLELTPAGEELHRRLLSAAKELEAFALAGLGERQQAELRRTLDQIRSNLAARGAAPGWEQAGTVGRGRPSKPG